MHISALFLLLLLPFQWETNFEAAQKTAKEHHKLILLNFSGSDWCGPCILLKKDYFDQQTFLTMADSSLVLVNADFPRKKKNMGDPELVKSNEELAMKFNKKGSFPLTLLLDPDGNVLHVWDGKPTTPVDKWTEEIRSLCIANKQ